MNKPYYEVSSKWDPLFAVCTTKTEAIKMKKQLQGNGDVGVYIKKKHRESLISDYRQEEI